MIPEVDDPMTPRARVTIPLSAAPWGERHLGILLGILITQFSSSDPRNGSPSVRKQSKHVGGGSAPYSLLEFALSEVSLMRWCALVPAVL